MEFSLGPSPSVVASETTGVILAIDYGQKRLGLALSDEHGVTSRPFATWTRTNRRRDLARLRELVRKQGVRRIVVGLPLHLDGTPSEMSEEVKGFAARVAKALGIPVEMMDERLTSWEAKQTVATLFQRAPSGARTRFHRPPYPASEPESKDHARKRRTRRPTLGAVPGERKMPIDDVAAALILRDYLDRVKSRTGLRD